VVSEHLIIYNDKEYKIIAAEQEFIIHPAALGIMPFNKKNIGCDFGACFYLEGQNLYLEKIKLKSNGKEYILNNCRLFYNGAILIAADMVDEFITDDGAPACFSYQNVKELIFNNGILVTGVDQNRAMHRIRKNLELGIRKLGNRKDIRCINRFLASALVGDYKPFKLSYNRHRYIKRMKNFYDKAKTAYMPT